MNTHDKEKGSATLIAILGLLAMYFFYKEAHSYLGENLHPALYWGGVALVGIITICIMGCSMHMRALGAQSPRQQYQDLQRQARELESLIRLSQETLKHFEKKVIDQGYGLSSRGSECITTVEKILKALEIRLYEVKKLMAYRSKIKMIDAYDLLHSPLVISQNCLDSLIDSEPLPALNPREWNITLDRLFGKIEQEIRFQEERLGAIRRTA